jgi:RHS repeat-associated protein
MLTVSTGSTTVTAIYDALGRVVENNVGGVYNEFVYAPTGAKVATVRGTTLVKALIALPGGAKAVYNSSGLAYYRHSDWLGSSRLTSTATAPTTAYSSSAYAPFGEQYAQSGTADASFTGQDSSTVSGLYDFPFRESSPSQGRWISPDPMGRGAVALANPQTWNRYAYVANNPLSFTDPLGLFMYNWAISPFGTCWSLLAGRVQCKRQSHVPRGEIQNGTETSTWLVKERTTQRRRDLDAVFPHNSGVRRQASRTKDFRWNCSRLPDQGFGLGGSGATADPDQ